MRTILFILFLVTAPSAFAGVNWFQKICIYVGNITNPPPATIVPGIPDRVIEWFKVAKPGSYVRVFDYNHQEQLGFVIDIDFNSITLLSKNQKIKLRWDHQSEVEAVEAKEIPPFGSEHEHALEPGAKEGYEKRLSFIDFRLRLNEIYKNVLSNHADEMRQMAEMNSKQRIEFGEQISKRVEEELRKKFGDISFGYHYAHNGGSPIDYLLSGGIVASINYEGESFNPNAATNKLRLYYFSSKNHSLFHVLNYDFVQQGPDGRPIHERMGQSLILFNFEKFEQNMQQKTKVLQQGEVFTIVEFPTDAFPLTKVGNKMLPIFVPSSDFLFPPVDVFPGALSSITVPGMTSRSWEENSVVALFMIEDLNR